MVDESQLGDAPIEPRYHAFMNELGRAIDKMMNGELPERKHGFILMLFPFEDNHGHCNYISNARRSDVLVMLKKQVERFESHNAIRPDRS
jgi:hypothetical protein